MLHITRLLLVVVLLNTQLQAAQFKYVGQLEQVSRDGSGTPLKEFQVTCFGSATNSTEVFFQLNESRPTLPWIERFGILTQSEPVMSPAGVAIGYRHLDRNYVLPVTLPFFAKFSRLEEGATWKDEQGDFGVSGEKVVNGKQCWQVNAMIGIARHHIFYVRKDAPIVEAGSETVFMGPGDRFRITYQMTEEQDKVENPAEFAIVSQLLLSMKHGVERSEFNRFQPLSSEQVQGLDLARAGLLDVAAKTLLAEFAKEIDQDLTTLLNRKGRVEDLSLTMVQRPSPKFTLLSLKGEEIPSTTFAGKTILLHFWDYANPSLEQPYGQIGYLDFVHNRWKDKNVLIYGVAVNSELTDPETRSKSIRNIQKLKQFMKLGYEMTVDGGAVLNSFGNPTRLGAELPLWVVLSPTGQILHYQTGYYEVDNRVGLKAIDEALEQATK